MSAYVKCAKCGKKTHIEDSYTVEGKHICAECYFYDKHGVAL